MKKHGAYPRPDAIDPWEHNRRVARRKKYRRLARQFRTASRQPGLRGLAAAFRDLGESAQRAADSLRALTRRDAA